MDAPTRLRDLPVTREEDLPAIVELIVDHPMARAPAGLEPSAEAIETVLRELVTEGTPRTLAKKGEPIPVRVRFRDDCDSPESGASNRTEVGAVGSSLFVVAVANE